MNKNNNLIISRTNINSEDKDSQLKWMLEKERKCAKKLKMSFGYLNRYNYLIRLMCLFILKNNGRIENNSIHNLLFQFIVDHLKFQPQIVTGIIKSRHRLKYNNESPESQTELELENIIILAFNKIVDIL